jgi:Big-like domain-containing protein
VRERTWYAVAVYAAVALAACSSDKNSTNPSPMTVTPDTVTVFVGDSAQVVANNAPGFITWSSSDSTIASVVHGTIYGLAPGQVTINAAVGNSGANATVTVSQPPQIGLSTTGVTFETSAGSTPPGPQTVGIANNGSGPLKNLAIGLVTYSQGASGWLTASLPANAATPATLTLQPNTTLLPPGTYSATVPVSAPSATNSPRSVTVTYIVDQASVLVLSRSSVPITGQANGTLPSTQTVNITSSGGSAVGGIAPGTITYSTGATGWLAASLTSSSTPATLTLTVTSTALAVGNYSATVPVTSTTAGVTPLNVTVTYTVTSTPVSPAISLASNTATFNATIGGTVPSGQQIIISNSGGGTLAGLGASITYISGSGWLSATLGGTTAPATVTLQPTTVLAAGTYQATVAVTATGASNSPQNISVTYVVTGAPVITLGSTTASFLSQQANVDPANQQIAVSNSGSGSLTGLSATVSYVGSTTGWLSASLATSAPQSPSSTPLTLQVTTGTITPGSYQATVTVASTVSGVAQKTVTVTFERQATLTNDVVTGVFVNGNCTSCHAGASPPDGVDLSSAAAAYANLVNVAPHKSGTGYSYLVVPGDSTNSFLYNELSGTTTDNMPFGCANGTGCISSALLHLVATWIQQGAAQ